MQSWTSLFAAHFSFGFDSLNDDDSRLYRAIDGEYYDDQLWTTTKMSRVGGDERVRSGGGTRKTRTRKTMVWWENSRRWEPARGGVSRRARAGGAVR